MRHEMTTPALQAVHDRVANDRLEGIAPTVIRRQSFREEYGYGLDFEGVVFEDCEFEYVKIYDSRLTMVEFRSSCTLQSVSLYWSHVHGLIEPNNSGGRIHYVTCFNQILVWNNDKLDIA